MTLPTMPDTLILDTPFYLAMVRVPAGEFIMGSDPNRDNFAQFDELPQHRVYVSEFYIGRYEVTNAQYMIYARVNGLPFEFPTGNDDHPVVHISWGETVGFCQWLSQVTGESVRLPTEAEWEKAARGTDGRLYPWGDNWDPTALNSSIGGAWDTTSVVKHVPAGNALCGAADMVGNVWEWTADWYDASEYADRIKSGLTVQDPVGPLGGTHRIMRGGSYYHRQIGTRAARRFKYIPTSRCYDIGFRVVMATQSES